jgi:hypothetical protein
LITNSIARKTGLLGAVFVIDATSMSGAMNALSFSEHAQGLMLWRAIGLGVAIPALVYAITDQ